MNLGALIAALADVDTPTVCNALVRLDPSLKGRNSTLDPVVPADAAMAPFTGVALTAKIVSSEPPADDHAALQARRFAYYRYLGAAQGTPSVIVMQDCGTRPGFGCIWGEIQVAIHRAMGLHGAVTDGAIRDLQAMRPDFGLLGGKVCPGSGFAHFVDFGTPVKVFGLDVNPGDLVHADRHGCVVIPAALADELPQAILRVAAREQTLLAALAAPGIDAQALIAAWTRFEATR